MSNPKCTACNHKFVHCGDQTTTTAGCFGNTVVSDPAIVCEKCGISVEDVRG